MAPCRQQGLCWILKENQCRTQWVANLCVTSWVSTLWAVIKKADGKNHCSRPKWGGCCLPGVLRCKDIEWHQDGYCHNGHDDQ